MVANPHDDYKRSVRTIKEKMMTEESLNEIRGKRLELETKTIPWDECVSKKDYKIPANAPIDDVILLYDRLRDHVRHEDAQVNNRLTWFLLFQGFMVFGYTTTLDMYAKQAINVF